MSMSSRITEDQLKYADAQNRPPHNRSHTDIGKELGIGQTQMSRLLKVWREKNNLTPPDLNSVRAAERATPKASKPERKAKKPVKETSTTAIAPTKKRAGAFVAVSVDFAAAGQAAEVAHDEFGAHGGVCYTCKEASSYDELCFLGKAFAGRWARLEITAQTAKP